MAGLSDLPALEGTVRECISGLDSYGCSLRDLWDESCTTASSKIISEYTLLYIQRRAYEVSAQQHSTVPFEMRHVTKPLALMPWVSLHHSDSYKKGLL